MISFELVRPHLEDLMRKHKVSDKKIQEARMNGSLPIEAMWYGMPPEEQHEWLTAIRMLARRKAETTR